MEGVYVARGQDVRSDILRKTFAAKQSFRFLLTLLTYVPVGKCAWKTCNQM